MLLNASRVEVWRVALKDEPGALAGKLEALAMAGANLEFVIARRRHDRPSEGNAYVTPITGAAQVEAAEKAGFRRAEDFTSLRIVGADEPGIGYRLTDALARAGINLRGLSAGRLGSQCVFYLALDGDQDWEKAVKIINRI